MTITEHAKLAAANMEWSERYYNGRWILCKDRLPEKTNSYLVTKYIAETEDNAEMSGGMHRNFLDNRR